MTDKEAPKIANPQKPKEIVINGEQNTVDQLGKIVGEDIRANEDYYEGQA